MEAQQDEKFNGVDHKLLDGYDSGNAPTPEFMQELMKNAPPEIQQRAKQFAEDKKKFEE